MFHTDKQLYINDYHDWLITTSFTRVSKTCERYDGSHFEADFYSGHHHTAGTVIALHSTGCDRFTPLVHFYQEFLNAGYNVLCFDLDGHGKDSSTTFNSEILLDTHTPHIIDDLISSFTTELEGEKIMLIGQSLGGASIVDFLTKSSHRKDITAAVLVGMPVNLNLKKISVLKESFNIVSPSLWANVSTFGLGGVIPAVGKFRRKVYPLRVPEGTSYLHHIPAYINGIDIINKCSEINVPTLNILGGLDSVAQDQPLMSNAKMIVNSNYRYETHYSLLFSRGYLSEVVAFFNDHQ